MPELPEVETVKRGLEPALTGRVIADVIVRRRDLRWPLPIGFAQSLHGAKVERLSRRAKYLLAHLDSGWVWLTHLGMSGRMTIFDTAPIPDALKHDHVEIATDAGTVIRFNDPRRFGSMDLIEESDLNTHKLLAHLGPEPLGNDFNAAHLDRVFEGRRTPLKAALLDQKLIAGLGNIYVCEALFRSGLHPERPAGQTNSKERARLASAIRDVLDDAIAAGGSSLRDHRQANGELGYFQHNFKVYGREDEPCPTDGCDRTIRRIVQSGRSTFYCEACQD